MDNEGYVLFVRKNALQVLIPKYGLEATLYLDSKTVNFEYDEQVCITVYETGYFKNFNYMYSLEA